MIILITGACGMIGSNLAHWLVENTGHKIICADDLSGGFIENIPNKIIFSDTTISDTIWNSVNDLFEYVKPGICYHFAAYAAEGRSNYIRRFNHLNNTVGTANIINACVNHNCKLIFTSSVAVYSGTPPFNEEMIPNPIDSYGVSKYCSEMDIRIAGEQQGLKYCIVRPRNVYGERQNLWDNARNVFGIWMNQIMNDEPMTIYGDGSNKRSFTYIGDILEPLYNAINVNNEIINLGSAATYSIKEANDLLQKITGYNKIVHIEPRHEVKDAYCEIEKSVKLLGFKDKTRLVDGLAKMWYWAQQQPKREKQIPPALEIFKTNHISVK